jgi:hypothetical protein
MSDVVDAPPGFERVLASFSICAASEANRPHWQHIEQVSYVFHENKFILNMFSHVHNLQRYVDSRTCVYLVQRSVVPHFFV